MMKQCFSYTALSVRGLFKKKTNNVVDNEPISKPVPGSEAE